MEQAACEFGSTESLRLKGTENPLSGLKGKASVLVSVRMPVTEWERLRQAAQANDRNYSQEVRRAIRLYLTRWCEASNPLQS